MNEKWQNKAISFFVQIHLNLEYIHRQAYILYIGIEVIFNENE